MEVSWAYQLPLFPSLVPGFWPSSVSTLKAEGPNAAEIQIEVERAHFWRWPVAFIDRLMRQVYGRTTAVELGFRITSVQIVAKTDHYLMVVKANFEAGRRVCFVTGPSYTMVLRAFERQLKNGSLRWKEVRY